MQQCHSFVRRAGRHGLGVVAVAAPGGRVLINSGNIRNPRATASQLILDETVWVINDLAESIVRSDPRYSAYRSILDDPA